MSESQTHVPEQDWPLRCRRCRHDLTGAPVGTGRVLCTACGSHTKYPPRPDEVDTRKMFITIAIVLTILAVLTTLFVVYIAGNPPPVTQPATQPAAPPDPDTDDPATDDPDSDDPALPDESAP